MLAFFKGQVTYAYEMIRSFVSKLVSSLLKSSSYSKRKSVQTT